MNIHHPLLAEELNSIAALDLPYDDLAGKTVAVTGATGLVGSYLLRALDAVEIPLLDHIVIAGRSAVSMRENGFVPTALWMKQQPQSALLRDWLLPPEAPSPKE